MKAKRLLLILSLFLILGSSRGTAPDRHLVLKSSYSYSQFPPREFTDEAWIGESAAVVKGRTLTTIFRFDLGKVWTVNVRAKKYFERSLDDLRRPRPEKEEEEEESIYELGWNYRPEYDWTLQVTGEIKTIQGLSCRHLRALGEADFSQLSLDLWISRDLQIPHADILKDFLFRPVQVPTRDWETIAGLHEDLTSHTLITCRERHESPIGSARIWEKIIDKLETCVPPAGIYDIPEGFEQVASMQELTGRR